MTLALIAGRGRLPDAVAQSVEGELMVAALEGFPPDALAVDVEFRIEQLGSFITNLKDRGVTEVCFAGAIRRPPLDPAAVDAATLPLVPRMMKALQEGDDAALRTVLGFFEEAGLTVRGAHEVSPDLLPPPGVLTARKPDTQNERDAERAEQIVEALGAADVGQSCVVHKGQALAVEALPGTDWMLESLVSFRDGQTGGIFFKTPKPGQDLRIDMPTIGSETVVKAARAGLDGIVISAGGVLSIGLADIVKGLDERGMFLWVRG